MSNSEQKVQECDATEDDKYCCRREHKIFWQ